MQNRRIVLDTNCLLASLSNIFVDCDFAAGATYIVSDDAHFNVLRDISFPQLLVLRLKEFMESLQNEK